MADIPMAEFETDNDKTRVQRMEQEQFILHSTDVPVSSQVFRFEGDAQHAAEMIARYSRGAKIYIAKLIASVSEPLPALKWSDDRISTPTDLGLSLGKLSSADYAQGCDPAIGDALASTAKAASGRPY